MIGPFHSRLITSLLLVVGDAHELWLGRASASSLAFRTLDAGAFPITSESLRGHEAINELPRTHRLAITKLKPGDCTRDGTDGKHAENHISRHPDNHEQEGSRENRSEISGEEASRAPHAASSIFTEVKPDEDAKDREQDADDSDAKTVTHALLLAMAAVAMVAGALMVAVVIVTACAFVIVAMVVAAGALVVMVIRLEGTGV